MSRHFNTHYGFVCGRHDAAWQPRSRNSQDWDLGCLEATGMTQESLASWRSSSIVARARRGVPVHCPAGTKSLPETLRTAGSAVQYDVVMMLWSSIEENSKKYHQNFLLCNNNEITACIAHYFINSFWQLTVHSFCRAMLCIARLLLSPGVRPSVCHVPELRQNE